MPTEEEIKTRYRHTKKVEGSRGDGQGGLYPGPLVQQGGRYLSKALWGGGVLLSQPLRFPTLAPTQALSSVWSSEARTGRRYVRGDKTKALGDHGPSCSTSGHVRQFDLVLQDRAQ